MVYGVECSRCGFSNDDCYEAYKASGGYRCCCDYCTDGALTWTYTAHKRDAALR